MAPVVKGSSNTPLRGRWGDFIDLDAGRIAIGEASIADVGWELFHLILDVASGFLSESSRGSVLRDVPMPGSSRARLAISLNHRWTAGNQLHNTMGRIWGL